MIVPVTLSGIVGILDGRVRSYDTTMWYLRPSKYGMHTKHFKELLFSIHGTVVCWKSQSISTRLVGLVVEQCYLSSLTNVNCLNCVVTILLVCHCCVSCGQVFCIRLFHSVK